MNEELLNALVEEWVFDALNLPEFYDRNDQREERLRQLQGQVVPIEEYETAYAFFYE